jgi:hypothetical protein
MKLGEVEFTAPTHVFGGYINLIPYSDDDDVSDASGKPFERRDEIVAKVFPPGDFGYMIKHHRPAVRTLDIASADGDEMKEHIKLVDTHIGIVVGVERDGKPGAVSINNPQTYQSGLFGDPDYPMVFVRPVLPDYVPGDVRPQIIANIRTMLVAFNTVSQFPQDYNGGDPLATYDVEKLKTHVEMMVKAVAGDASADAFFKDPDNLIYCAELAHVGTSAGLHFPLNDATMVPLVGQQVWDTFKAEVVKHNAGEKSLFMWNQAGTTKRNRNGLVSLINLAIAPEDLKAVPDYAPDDIKAAEKAKLAFKPMTMADTIEQFLRTHIPREQMGEQVAPLQAAVLKAMLPGIVDATGMDRLPPEDPRVLAVTAVFAEIVGIVEKPYGSYAEFREAIEPGLQKARMITGPRPGSQPGKAFFVPPSLLHVVAQGKHKGGLLELKYEGHGVHISQLQLKPEPSAPPEPEPVVPPAPQEPFANSCVAACGVFAPDLSCACDPTCATYGDCCPDYEEQCVNN